MTEDEKVKEFKKVDEKELLPCPFCGADAFIWKHQNGFKISCVNDCVTMPPRFDMAFSVEEGARKHWNHRTLREKEEVDK